MSDSRFVIWDDLKCIIEVIIIIIFFFILLDLDSQFRLSLAGIS